MATQLPSPICDYAAGYSLSPELRRKVVESLVLGNNLRGIAADSGTTRNVVKNALAMLRYRHRAHTNPQLIYILCKKGLI